jgi:hypothetical protein
MKRTQMMHRVIAKYAALAQLQAAATGSARRS